MVSRRGLELGLKLRFRDLDFRAELAWKFASCRAQG